jgi:hypothetical protein
MPGIGYGLTCVSPFVTEFCTCLLVLFTRNEIGPNREPRFRREQFDRRALETVIREAANSMIPRHVKGLQPSSEPFQLYYIFTTFFSLEIRTG